MTIGKSKIIAISVFIISFTAFLFSFLFNPFHVLVKNKTLANQAESMVIGRLVKSRADGIFSAGGLCGRCTVEALKDSNSWNYQYRAYKENLPCKSYYSYLSQIGFHAVVYSLIDKISTFSPDTNLWILRAFKTGTLALVMSLIVLWFFLESGLLSAVFVFLGVLLTPWFTYLGSDLWFCVWTNFLPFMVLLFLLKREHNRQKHSEFRILLYTSIAIMINFIFNGYEWVSTTLIMATIPFFYYWRKDKWPISKLVRRVLWLAAGSIVSLLATFSILVLQIAQVKGKFSDGIDWIIYSFMKRSYGGPNIPESYAKQIDHSLGQVFDRYFFGTAIKFPSITNGSLPPYLQQIYFGELLVLFLIISVLVAIPWIQKKIIGEKKEVLVPLVITTWISILAPLSWMIIFKGHAYSHAHINYIIWFMPFCLFGLSMLGATISTLVDKVNFNSRKRFP
jgi:hypothetical protein